MNKINKNLVHVNASVIVDTSRRSLLSSSANLAPIHNHVAECKRRVKETSQLKQQPDYRMEQPFTVAQLDKIIDHCELNLWRTVNYPGQEMAHWTPSRKTKALLRDVKSSVLAIYKRSWGKSDSEGNPLGLSYSNDVIIEIFRSKLIFFYFF